MNKHRIAIVGAGFTSEMEKQQIWFENGYSIEFVEPQSEITGVWLDEMFQVETEPLHSIQLNIQYGPQKKRGKGKVKKW